MDHNFQKSLTSSNIPYNIGDILISLFYKKNYKALNQSYSVELEPDYSLEVSNISSGKSLKIFFDAKFKFDDGSVKSEDIHKMHTYKDAINGYSSIVLFPGHNNIFYKDHSSNSPFSGVGAFVMKLF